jgi:hypothetical protein
MQRSRFGAFALAAAAALAMGSIASSGAAMQLTAQKAVVSPTGGRRFETRRERFGGAPAFGASHSRRSAYGWTNAHQKRVAQKKRNQARHRKACGG